MLGVSAVDDLLQEGVADCIVDFKDAGMKVWMLTGDKGLTAKMIAIKCGLIPHSSLSDEATESVLIQITSSVDYEEIEESINQAIEKVKNCEKFQLMLDGTTFA